MDSFQSNRSLWILPTITFIILIDLLLRIPQNHRLQSQTSTFGNSIQLIEEGYVSTSECDDQKSHHEYIHRKDRNPGQKLEPHLVRPQGHLAQQ